jgi:hypothetical protein
MKIKRTISAMSLAVVLSLALVLIASSTRVAAVQNPKGIDIEWFIQPAGPGVIIPPLTLAGISNYNNITSNISVKDGFLSGTNGLVTNPDRTIAGKSTTRAPKSLYETALFALWYPNLDVSQYTVAAVELYSAVGEPVVLSVFIHHPSKGTIIRRTNINFYVHNAACGGGDPDYTGYLDVLGTDPYWDENWAFPMVLSVGRMHDFQGVFPFEAAQSDTKMAWVWVKNP